MFVVVLVTPPAAVVVVAVALVAQKCQQQFFTVLVSCFTSYFTSYFIYFLSADSQNCCGFYWQSLCGDFVANLNAWLARLVVATCCCLRAHYILHIYLNMKLCTGEFA